MDELERARNRRYAEQIGKRTGLDVEEVVAMALQAEQDGATREQVRAILDGDLSVLAHLRER